MTRSSYPRLPLRDPTASPGRRWQRPQVTAADRPPRRHRRESRSGREAGAKSALGRTDRLKLGRRAGPLDRVAADWWRCWWGCWSWAWWSRWWRSPRAGVAEARRPPGRHPRAIGKPHVIQRARSRSIRVRSRSPCSTGPRRRASHIESRRSSAAGVTAWRRPPTPPTRRSPQPSSRTRLDSGTPRWPLLGRLASARPPCSRSIRAPRQSRAHRRLPAPQPSSSPPGLIWPRAHSPPGRRI